MEPKKNLSMIIGLEKYQIYLWCENIKFISYILFPTITASYLLFPTIIVSYILLHTIIVSYGIFFMQILLTLDDDITLQPRNKIPVFWDYLVPGWINTLYMCVSTRIRNVWEFVYMWVVKKWCAMDWLCICWKLRYIQLLLT